MIIANFKNDSYPIAHGATQWNYGEVLRIQGLILPKAVEIHFSLDRTCGQSVTRIGTTKDGVTDVVIPDSLLENEGALQDYFIYVWVYVTDGSSGRTEHKLKIKVEARSKPEIPGGNDNADPFREAVEAVNSAAERAESAEQKATEHAEQTKLDAQQTTADRQEVEKLVDSVSGIGEQVEAAKDYAEQAQTAATNALLSEQKSNEAKESAIQAQACAETAEGMAEQHALEVAGDKTEVERLATQVRQDKTAVEQAKTAVDKTAQDFTLSAQQAVADVNNAGQTQTERVQSAGTTAVENIKTAQTAATGAVETKKTEAINAIQAEGATQVGNVTAEGEKQVQAVQTAAQEIIADREQITRNATDIAELRQTKADAIVESANGTLLNIKDSANTYFEDFSMHGKTTQDGTPTPDVFVPIVNAGESGNIEIKVTGKNLIPFPYPKLGGVGATGTINGVTYTVLEDRGIKLTGKAIKTVFINLLQNFEFANNKKYVYSDGLKSDYNNGLIFYNIIEGNSINKTYYPQIEHGTVATEYEQYKEPQTITLQLDKPITKWDRIEKRDGIWGIVRKSDKKILDGTEGWSVYKDYINNGLKCYAVYDIPCELGFKKSVCTHFKNVDEVWNIDIGKNGYYSDHETVMFKYFITDKPTVEEFKLWLVRQKEAGTPVELVYKTQTETWEPLPEETQLALNNLHTNYPTTVITNSEDCEMEVEYIADTKHYIDKKFEELNQAIVNTQIALL